MSDRPSAPESLRSGTIERTETVAHVQKCSQEALCDDLRASGAGSAQIHADEPAGPPCRKCGLDERDCEGDVMGCCAECSHPSGTGRWEWVADDEVVVKLPPGWQALSSSRVFRLMSNGWEPHHPARDALRAIADGIDRKEPANIENPEDVR